MRISLQIRLLLTLMFVVAVAMGTVALLASRVSASELQRYIIRDSERNRIMMDSLLSFYKTQPTAESLQAMVSSLSERISERMIVTDSNNRVLADSANELIDQVIDCDFDSPGIIVTKGTSICTNQQQSVSSTLILTNTSNLQLRPVPSTSFALQQRPATSETLRPLTGTLMVVAGQITDESGEISLISVRRIQGDKSDPIQLGFLSAVNRSLWMAVGVASMVGLLLTMVLGRGILRPINALTVAARRMGQGDLSQRVVVHSNDEIGELAHAFNAMADGLTRIERLRQHMVNDIAHELRTPLTNIRGYLEAVRDGVAEPTDSLIDSLHEEALLLNRLVDDLRDLALAEAKQLRLNRAPTDLACVIDSAVTALRPATLNRQLNVRVALPDDLPAVHADAERIGQVMRNLLNNAITHTPIGGEISVQAHVASTHVVVQVYNSGEGIAPEHLPLIFERFYRADRSRTRATGGAGLGLTIVKQLVEAHDGQVWATSEPQQGATFSFTLPICKQKSEQQADQPTARLRLNAYGRGSTLK